MSRYIDYDTWELIKKNLSNSLHPVGEVITNSLASFDPNVEYPGTTWVRIKGRVIVGVEEGSNNFSSSGLIGGSTTHKLTIAELPSHTHSQKAHNHSGNASGGDHRHELPYGGKSGGAPSGSGYTFPVVSTEHTHMVIAGTGNHSHTLSINDATAENNNTGGSSPHNNLQPYITKYVWERIA